MVKHFDEAKDAGDSLHHVYNLPAILSFLPKTRSTLLDAGCGNGSLTAKLANLGHTVVGIDTTPANIDVAKAHFPQAKFYCRSVYEDLSDILPDKVDVCVSCEVIEHLYSPDDFIDGMAKVLRPGGLVILTTPYHGWLKNLAISVVNGWDKHFMVHHEGAHIKFFSKDTLFAMLSRHGFTNLKFRGAGRLPYLWASMAVCAERP